MSEHEYETEQNAVAGDSLIAVLDELAQIVAGARGVPMSASAMINRSEVLDLLETARDIVPDQIEAADRIIAEASEVKEDAQRRAKTILERAHADSEATIAQARQKAADLVTEHAITEGARNEAASILEEARLQAERMNAGADRYSDDSLGFLQAELESLLTKVHAGRQELERRQEARVHGSQKPAPEAQGVTEEALDYEGDQDLDHDGYDQDGPVEEVNQYAEEEHKPRLNEIRVSPIDEEEEFEPPYENER